MELLALQPRGFGGKNNAIEHNESDWMLDGGNEDGSSEESSNFIWSYETEDLFSDEGSSYEELGKVEGEDGSCLTDMIGNYILPIGKVIDGISRNLC